MKAYSNKPERLDQGRCLYSEIKKGRRAAKKAARFQSKQLTKKK